MPKEVTRAVPALPALSTTLSPDDVSLSRIHLGQPQSPLVQDSVVPLGSIYATMDQDDPEPELLWSPPKKGSSATAPGVVFHVLDLRKGKSISIDNQLVRFDFDDPDAPADAWRTYDYTVCLPEAEQSDMPYKVLFTRTATPSAKKINSLLARSAANGPAYLIAFAMTTAERKKDQYRWYVPQLTVVEATDAGLAASEKLDHMVKQSSVESAPSDDSSEPAI